MTELARILAEYWLYVTVSLVVVTVAGGVYFSVVRKCCKADDDQPVIGA